MLLLVVTAVRVLAHGDLNPGGDRALIELRVRDIGSHTPLLGSYGRYGFNQLATFWFFVLAVGPHPSAQQLIELFVAHPELRSIGDQLSQIPASPILSIVGRPIR